MKKTISVLLAILIIFFCGCKSKSSNASANILIKLSDGEKLIGDFFVYSQAGDISSEGYIGSEMLAYLYYGKNEALLELNSVQNFCIAIDKSKSCREIHIYKVKNDSDVFAIERMLGSRGKYLCKAQINPNDSDYLTRKPSGYAVSHKGKFVFLCVGEYCENILSAAERCV